MNNVVDITEEDFEQFHFLRINPETKEFGPVMPLMIDCGWYPLVYTLCVIINGYLHRCNDLDLIKNFYVLSVKEKLGGLRFYVSTYDKGNYLYELIQRYELKSYSVCESCGAEGTLIKFPEFLKTVCFQDFLTIVKSLSFMDRVYLVFNCVLPYLWRRKK